MYISIYGSSILIKISSPVRVKESHVAGPSSYNLSLYHWEHPGWRECAWSLFFNICFADPNELESKLC